MEWRPWADNGGLHNPTGTKKVTPRRSGAPLVVGFSSVDDLQRDKSATYLSPNGASHRRRSDDSQRLVGRREVSQDPLYRYKGRREASQDSLYQYNGRREVSQAATSPQYNAVGHNSQRAASSECA